VPLYKEVKVIGVRSCLEDACSLSVFCTCHLVNAKFGSPIFKVLQKIAEKSFVPGLSRKMLTGSVKILAGRLQPYSLEM